MAPLSLRHALMAAALITSATADFHLLLSEGDNVPSEYFTCPSNHWTSKCWCDGDRRSSESSPSVQPNGEYKVTLDKVCGADALDFWYRPKTDRWEAYVPNGDGKVKATCYRQPKKDGGDQPYTKIDECLVGLPIKYDVFDGWICYSDICRHA